MKTWRVVSWVTATCFLAACGGGGGGGGGDDGIEYTGKTTQALITRDNARIVAEALVLAAPVVLEDSSNGPLLRTAPARAPQFSAFALGRLLSGPVRTALSQGAERNAGRRLALTESDSDPGSCGGTVSFQLTVDEASGDLRGTMTFSSDYCDDGVMTSGEVSIDGAVDPIGGIEWIEISTEFLTVRDPAEAYDVSMSGTIRVASDDLTLDVALRDNETEAVFRFESFRFAQVDGQGDETLTVDGRYYDPGEGYVDFVTVSPLVLDDADDGPRAGEVEALGRDGTTSRLTALSPETYRIDADLNGDGDYGDAGIDYSSGDLNWADL